MKKLIKKKLNIKIAVVLTCMTFGFAGTAKGQISSDEALFYKLVEGNGLNSMSILIIKPEGNHLLVFTSGSGKIERDLAKDPNLYEKGVGDYKSIYDYYSPLSTSKRSVYRRSVSYGRPCWEYVAVLENQSTVLIWSEPKSNPGGERSTIYTYSRTSKEDYLPKSINYDFLND